MCTFLKASATPAVIEKIFRDAKSQLVIVTPNVRLSVNLIERLHDVASRGVPIRIIFGKDQPKREEVSLLPGMPGISMYFLKHLHATCYFSECQLLITSMNLYSFSLIENRNVGMFIERKITPLLFEDAMNETESLIRLAMLKEKKKQPDEGHAGKWCDGCGKPYGMSSGYSECERCFKKRSAA